MPIIWHIMKIYSHFGHREFILPLGFKGDLIKEYFMNFHWRANNFTLNLMDKDLSVHENHKNENWTIHFVDTGLETKTALRLKKVKNLLEQDNMFMLTYGDGVADMNIKKLVDFHLSQKKIATITAIRVPSRFGSLSIQDNCLKKFEEKPCDDSYINGGFMVLNSAVFDDISDEDVMLEEANGPLVKLVARGQVAVYQHKGLWQCMDTYRDYLKLNQLWKENPQWKLWE